MIGVDAASLRGSDVVGDASGTPPTASAPPVTFWQTIVPVIDAFLLGWRITELKSRIAIAAALTKASTTSLDPPLTGSPVEADESSDSTRADLGEPAWMASVWRAAFKQITAAHAKEFPDVSTAGTLYEPPGGWANEKLIAYLYPKRSDDGMTDYTGVGLSPSAGEDTLFSIQGVTRRALNALIILYSSSNDELIANTIRGFQQALLQAMGHTADPDRPPEFETQRREGVADLSARTLQLLEGWDGFLHEQYYANATQSPERATKLIAFEAGRSLAWLTWSISVNTVVLEREPSGTPTPGQALLRQWQAVFDANNVIRAQHYVSTLGSALNSVYAAFNRTSADSFPPASQQSSAVAGFDPALPSNICRAIRDSLDHWSAAVAWLKGVQDSNTAIPVAFFRRLRVALIAQSDLWLALLATEQSLESFTLETVMNQLVQNVLMEIEDQFVQQTGGVVRQNFRSALRLVPSLAWVILGGSGLVILTALIWLWITHPTLTALNANGLWALLGIGGLGPALAALLGGRAASASQPGGAAGSAPPGNAPVARADGVLRMLEASASESFRAAYAQIRQELAAFNHSTGVTYPLIECFVLDNRFPAVQKIQNTYSFVAEVIWTSDERRKEIEDVVRAALGPVSLLIGARGQDQTGEG